MANDIKADENGVWTRKGSPVAYVSVHKIKKNRQCFIGHKWAKPIIIIRLPGHTLQENH